MKFRKSGGKSWLRTERSNQRRCFCVPNLGWIKNSQRSGSLKRRILPAMIHCELKRKLGIVGDLEVRLKKKPTPAKIFREEQAFCSVILPIGYQISRITGFRRRIPNGSDFSVILRKQPMLTIVPGISLSWQPVRNCALREETRTFLMSWSRSSLKKLKLRSLSFQIP